MLSISCGITENTNNIYDPIAEQIIRRTLDSINASDIFGNSIYRISDNSVPSHSSDTESNPVLGTQDKVTYTQEVNTNPGDLQWDAMYHDHVSIEIAHSTLNSVCPLLYHTKSGTMLSEYGQPITMRLEVVVNVQNRSTAQDILTGLFIVLDANEPMQRTEAIYHYPVPHTIVTKLYEIAGLCGYQKELFVPWLRKHSSDTLGIVVNKNKSDRRELVVRKNVKDILILLECSQGKPEPVKQDQANTAWQVSFSIVCQFVRPMVQYIRYHPVVNNKLVPIQNPDELYDYSFEEVKGRNPFFAEDAYKLLVEETYTEARIPIMRLPWYDDWVPSRMSPIHPLKYRPFAILLFTLDDENNPHGETVIDLCNLGELQILPVILDEIRATTYNYLTFSGKYHVSVYVNDIMLDPTIITVEDKTKLHIPCRDKNKVYRLVLTVNETDMQEKYNLNTLSFVDIVVNRGR